jgi:hypothetical protein
MRELTLCPSPGQLLPPARGTPVTDAATLSGDNASAATGTVTYTVYLDVACTDAVNTGTPEPDTTAGTFPASSPVTLIAPGH